MSERIAVTVHKDGTIGAVTAGMHGERCLDFVEILEALLDATATESAFTEDYETTDAVDTEKYQVDELESEIHERKLHH